MKKEDTQEGKARTRTGVLRMVLAIISIVLEILVIVLIIFQLSEYALWIEITIRILAVVVVLAICGQYRTAGLKLPWLVMIVALPIFGVVLYLLIGLNGVSLKMRHRYRAVNEKLLPLLPDSSESLAALRERDPVAAGIAEYIASRSGYPLWGNTDVVYYSDAAEGLEAQLTALQAAEKFIFMEYHAIEDKESWKRIEDVLAERAAAGLDVRLFYDDMGSIGFITTSFAKKVEKRGIKCCVFNPFTPGLNVFLNNRDHRKITVIDGKVGFTGGYNLADEYFNITHPFGLWKDTGVRLEGDAVRSLTVIFMENWRAMRGKDDADDAIPGFLPQTDYTAVGSAFVQPYGDNPLNKERIGQDVYISMAEKAVRYCYFVTPYLILPDEVIYSLGLAAKRGVDVRIVTPGIPDKKLVYNVTRSYYHPLVAAGAKIYEWSPGFCHCKMSVTDDKMATCGTINMDYRSFYHHFENGCFICDEAIASEIRADIEEMMQAGREVTEEYRVRPNSIQRFSEMIVRLFSGLL